MSVMLCCVYVREERKAGMRERQQQLFMLPAAGVMKAEREEEKIVFSGARNENAQSAGKIEWSSAQRKHNQPVKKN